jgi:hypothetical protein
MFFRGTFILSLKLVNSDQLQSSVATLYRGFLNKDAQLMPWTSPNGEGASPSFLMKIEICKILFFGQW